MLRKVNLELTVLDYDRIGGSDPIGRVLLGYNRKKLEKKHWAEMVDNPRRPVIHWHVLQVSEVNFYCTRTMGHALYVRDVPHIFYGSVLVHCGSNVPSAN